MNREHYKKLAHIFAYPDEGYAEKMKECMEILQESYPTAAKEFERFHTFATTSEFDHVEFIFTKTFHIQAICYLDLGYVLFGEDYKRGEFLVQMKREQAKVNNDCGHELADNLPNVLNLLAISPDDEFVGELSVRAIIPTLEKMLQEFDISRLQLKMKVMKKKQKAILLEETKEINFYQNAIQALKMVMEEDFKDVHYELPDAAPEFANKSFLSKTNCGTCGEEHAPDKKETKTTAEKAKN